MFSVCAVWCGPLYFMMFFLTDHKCARARTEPGFCKTPVIIFQLLEKVA